MKIRTDFVTNSSSSSFILAFDSERDIANEICDNYTGEFLGRIITDIKNKDNKKSIDEVVEEYLDNIKWYPVTYNIKRKLQEDMGLSNEEFCKWVSENQNKIDEMVDEELNIKEKSIRDKLNEKNYICMIEYEDSWPDSELYDVCNNLPSLVGIIDYH